jgi:hypothetical protein
MRKQHSVTSRERASKEAALNPIREAARAWFAANPPPPPAKEQLTLVAALLGPAVTAATRDCQPQ